MTDTRSSTLEFDAAGPAVAPFLPQQTPYAVNSREFPVHGTWEERMAFLVRYATLAPSEPKVLDRDATVEKACQLVAEAAGNGASLIVFPETFIPVYPNATIWGQGLLNFGGQRQNQAWARLWNNSVEIPGPATDRLAKAAREARATVVMGVNERSGHNHTL